MVKLKIAVIGGGASGTAAAHRLSQLGYKVAILEKSDQLGGRIKSKSADGANVEMGASFITSGLYPKTFRVLQETGLNKDLRLRISTASIVKDSLEHTPRSLLGNSWLSLGAKIAATSRLGRLMIQGRKLSTAKLWQAEAFDTESVAEAFTSKQDKEVMEYLIQPILNGYFYWNPERTSIAMLMILLNSTRASGKTYTLQHGLQQIPQTLAKSSEIRLKCEVKTIQKSALGLYTITVIQDGKKQVISNIAGVVCATTATAVPRILPGLTDKQRSFFEAISYSSTAVVAHNYHRTSHLPARGVAYPRLENNNLAAVTSASVATNEKFVETVKTFASGAVGHMLVAKDDTETMCELAAVSALNSRSDGSTDPFEIFVQRWPEALPEYDVGHIKRLKTFVDGEIEIKGDRIVFAGDYIGGPFIEGAITSGLQAAKRLHAGLQAESS